MCLELNWLDKWGKDAIGDVWRRRVPVDGKEPKPNGSKDAWVELEVLGEVH